MHKQEDLSSNASVLVGREWGMLGGHWPVSLVDKVSFRLFSKI